MLKLAIKFSIFFSIDIIWGSPNVHYVSTTITIKFKINKKTNKSLSNKRKKLFTVYYTTHDFIISA
jgi:hypothetical protein